MTGRSSRGRKNKGIIYDTDKVKKKIRSLGSSKKGLFVTAVVIWSLAFGSFYLASSFHKEDIRISKEIASLETWKERKIPEDAWAFMKELKEKPDPAAWEENLSSLGIAIDDFKEKNDKNGPLWEVTGHGTYEQICQAFAIIGNSKNWSVMDLRELRRDGENLKFKAQIITYRSRGSYEKKKYRSHRPHGDRQKPGSQNTI